MTRVPDERTSISCSISIFSPASVFHFFSELITSFPSGERIVFFTVNSTAELRLFSTETTASTFDFSSETSGVVTKTPQTGMFKWIRYSVARHAGRCLNLNTSDCFLRYF